MSDSRSAREASGRDERGGAERNPLDAPELQVITLEPQAVERTFYELAFETTVLTILIKGGTTARAVAPAPSLGTARDVFLAGEASGLQIHYEHRGERWWATLMSTAGVTRFVRVRRNAAP